MRRLLPFIALLAALCWVAPSSAQQGQVGPPNGIICNQIAQLASGGTGLTKIITGVAGQRVYLCGWHMTNTGASGTFAFNTGTGSNCGSNTATIVPAQNVTSNAPSGDHQQLAFAQTAVAVDFCVNPSVSTIAGVIYYAQF